MTASSHPSDINFGVGGSDQIRRFWLDELISIVPRMDQALCAQTDPELFFPVKGGSSVPGKTLCGRCPEMQPCRKFALESPDQLDGIWGGMTERDRRAYRKTGWLPPAPGAVCGKGIPHRPCGHDGCADLNREWFAGFRAKERAKKKAA